MSLIQNYIKHIQAQQPTSQRVYDRNELIEAFKATGKYLQPSYEYDETAVAMMPFLFTEKKGAVFSGSKGLGKTLNLDIFATINTQLFKIPTETFEVTEIEIKYKANGADWLLKISELPCLVINDIGIESNLNDYGTNRNVIADLLFLRYRQFQKYGKRTFLTANLKRDTIESRYATKLADRFKEMFNFVELKGESKR